MRSMRTRPLPPTVNLHSLAPCNYECGFCYAGFASARRPRIPQVELHEIIHQIGAVSRLHGRGPRKVTFAGGEPLLSPTAIEDIAFARTQGLVTSLVTNGSLLTKEKIHRLAPFLDWLTISIDSLDDNTNRRIGRAARGVPISAAEYLARIQTAHELGIRVKLNTVVNQANVTEDFNGFVRAARPSRWKLLQATRIAEENGDVFDRWAISEATFRAFVARHANLSIDGVVLVPETQADVYGTYAMVGPNGSFFDNSQGTYRYSRPIVRVGLEAAWAEITFSAERFRARQGEYNFATGSNSKEVA
jgi:radical S-adenosyl methionine domain-containing protein 2